MRPFLGTMTLALFAAVGSAQHQAGHAASSQTYFMAAVELGSGEDAATALYELRSSQGSGVVVEPDAGSATYRMRGGYFGAATAPVLGQPWLTGAQPFHIDRTGNSTMILRGTELWLGPTPTVTIGGQVAPVISRTSHQMLVAVPDQPVPGFQPVTFTNVAGTSTMNEGVGVLPMIEKREPLNGAHRNYIRITTRPTEVLLLVLGSAPGPATQILDFEYFLLLDEAQVFFADIFYIGDPEGRFTIPLPPYPSGLVWVQGLAVTPESGYTAGSWSNAVAL